MCSTSPALPQEVFIEMLVGGACQWSYGELKRLAQVCSVWRATIKSSTKLDAALFREAPSSSTMPLTPRRALHPLLQRFVERCKSSIEEAETESTRPGHPFLLVTQHHPAVGDQVCSPPATEVELREGYFSTITNPSGVTVFQVLQAYTVLLLGFTPFLRPESLETWANARAGDKLERIDVSIKKLSGIVILQPVYSRGGVILEW